MAKAVKPNDMVRVFIPKKDKNDTERYVAVNGERLLVKTGMELMLPARFAEVIENSFAQEREAERYIEMYAKD